MDQPFHLLAAARRAVEMIYDQEPPAPLIILDFARLSNSPYPSKGQQDETGLAKGKLIAEQMGNLQKFYALSGDDATTIAALME